MAFSVAKLAEQWDCSREHIYGLIESGKLKSFMIGKKRGIRISEEEVKRWEDEQTKTPIQSGRSGSDGREDSGAPISRMAKLGSARG